MKRIVTHISPSTLFGLLLTMAMIMVAGCADDLLYNPDDFEEGDGSLRMSINFEPLNAIDMSTRTPGNAIHDINSLAIVFFDTEGNLVKIVNQGDPEIKDWVLNQDGNTTMPSGASVGSQAEAKTPRATFRLVNLNIPYGKYNIYAVANMGRLTSSSSDPLTEEKLKSTVLEWKEDVSQNNQMFGYFTTVANAGGQGGMPSGFGPQTVEIKENTSPRLHSWLRRAASKVTVAYDGSGLKDNVWIYINKVTIRDIPKTCYLGQTNSPDSENDLITEGSSLYYDVNGVVPEQQASTDHNNWLTITNDDQEPVGSDHSETAQALFFYENMQGDFTDLPEAERKKYDKKHGSSPQHGVLVDPGDPDYKDEVPYGTWIEVEAYYESTNPDNLGSGKIIYRFMLGKDVEYNYNAERNHHFKLTLKFNGWANQADWHIEYTEEDPSIQRPPLFYMPYLYNQQAMLPLKFNGNIKRFEVEIIENGWGPVNPTDHNIPAQTVGDFEWNLRAYEMLGPIDYAQYGFLALAVPNNTGLPEKSILMDYKYQDKQDATDALDAYYRKTEVYENLKWSQQKREYSVVPGTHQPGNNQYVVTKADQGNSIAVQIPLWTRNKTMIQNSGFTGNNPYEEFERMAKIKITAYFDVNGEEKKLEEVMPVYQVRRIVNPKGIWRSYSDNESFFVHLMTLSSPLDTQYHPLTSQGSWDASIESGDKSFCYITTSATSTTGMTTINGNTGSEIKFYVKFHGNVTSGNSKGCVININYNGGSCTHKILVRQGYDEAVPITGSTPLWSSFNLFSCSANDNINGTKAPNVSSTLTQNPLAIGSLFKRLNYTYGILIANNEKYGPLVPVNGGGLSITKKNAQNKWQTATWNNISAYATGTYYDGNNTTWGTFRATPPGSTAAKTYRVPTYREYQSLDNAEYAIGVVYADGATDTKVDFSAYSFNDPNNTLKRSTNGVRGIIVYNPSTGNQILFPLGEFGMARRTQFNIGSYTPTTANPLRGYLRYGDTPTPLTSDNDLWRPIPYNIPECPGAIYWINNPITGGHPEGAACGGWDMNYFSLDFSSYTNNNRNDACPIKLVLVE